MAAPDQGRDWQHLGRSLRAARGGRSRSEVERLSGVSATQIKRYEAGLVTPPEIPDKMWMLATFYGWTPDSIGKVLAGGEPTLAPPDGGTLVPSDGGVTLTPAILDKALGVISQADAMSSAEKRAFYRWVLAHAD